MLHRVDLGKLMQATDQRKLKHAPRPRLAELSLTLSANTRSRYSRLQLRMAPANQAERAYSQ
jgi:hypothetical protein